MINIFDRFPRMDFSPLPLPQDLRIEMNKTIGRFRHIGEKEAKPGACVLCGADNPSFCNSHTIPQFCLREIAVNGKLRTINTAIEIDLLRKDEGINSAGTFRMICRECDSKFFSDYENPDRFNAHSPLGNDLLGKIAVKVLLLEQYKARMQMAFLSTAFAELGMDIQASNTIEVRSQDQVDFARQLEHSLLCAQNKGDGYRVLLDIGLQYTVPLAFQGQITLAADFEGNLINDVLNYSDEYRIEPLYVCIFPFQCSSRVLVFCRDASYARYSKFHRRLRALCQGDALQAVLKMIVGYSEEVYFSPLLPESIFVDKGFAELSRLSNMRLASEGEVGARQRKRLCSEYALDSMPKLPKLLHREYSMQKLRDEDAESIDGQRSNSVCQ